MSNIGAVSRWAQDTMIWANGYDLFKDVGGTLNAQSAANRAQVASILMNYGAK